MDLISEKSRCCGCMACVDICPQNAIAAEADAEGFLYPKMNQALCINCRRCKDVCPFSDQEFGETPRQYFAVQAKSKTLREESTSGAVFPMIAEAILEQSGAVYGAGFNSSMQVVHRRAANRDNLNSLTKTKYVQSDTTGTFRCVQQDLQEGKEVLFVGTPCQVEALKRFLPKEYSNLLLVDLVCYGVPSPGVWARYIAYLEKTYHGKLVSFQFRDKRGQNNGHLISYRIGDQEYVEDYEENLFISMYVSNCTLRPSCHVCPFISVKRSSDITLGDFWGIEKVFPNIDDGMGTSLVMLRSKRGIELWENLQNRFYYLECSREAAEQPRLVSPTIPSPRRKLFFALFRVLPFGVFVWMKRFRRFWCGSR